MAKKMYSFYIDIELLKRAKEKAKEQNRTVSNLIETAILAYLNNN